MKNYDDITIRSIQQYLYCKHRFGLIEFDCSFEKNFYVYRGDLLHLNVDQKKGMTSRGVIHECEVTVYHDEWNLYGVVDRLEFRKNSEGVYISKYDDYFDMTIVEYKATAPKDNTYRYEDKMQVLAQKICIDQMFQTNAKAYFYYGNTRKRVLVEFIEEDYIFLRNTIQEMMEWIEKQEIPPYDQKQKCSGCSIRNICLPKKIKDKI